MRRIGLAPLALALAAGCAHHHEPAAAAPPDAVAREGEDVGRTHQPYRGMPRYLAEARPLQATTSGPSAGAPNPCPTRSASCDARLRAVLASIDGQILALDTPPTAVQLQALRLAVIQLTPLLTPYPDMTAERDELGDLVEKLPTLPTARQPEVHKRMTELTDLMRVQLAAAQ